MEKLPVSIVVPVSKDVKIERCLDSVDVDAEIVVVLNNHPSRDVIDMVRRDMRAVLVFMTGDNCNLATAFNEGVAKTKHEKVILTNSDCVFPKGLIHTMVGLLDVHEVVKSRVEFEYKTFEEYLVARLRHLFHHVYNGSLNLFGPGLGFSKSMTDKIGGHLFDEDLAWGEDGELSRRIHDANLDLKFTDQYLLHAAERMPHDLMMAGKIGRGKRVRDMKSGVDLLPGALKVVEETVFDKRQYFKLACEQEGISVGTYLLLWRLSFLKGYMSKEF